MQDLHTHSTYSDGTFEPSQLIDYALAHGVTQLALTDHDTIDGVMECQEYGASKGLTVIPGFELSVNWNHKVIHIVALDIDVTSGSLNTLLKKQQDMRQIRAIAIGQQLEETMGLKNGYEKALRLATGNLVARPHFARILIDESYCKDMKTAFSRYLKRGKCGYVRTNWVDLSEGLRIIAEAGGVAVLAHPKKYKLTSTKLNELLTDFKTMGGSALEVISGLTPRDDISHLSALCQKYDLLASIGSDFHGEILTPHSMKRLGSLPKVCKALMDSPIMEKYK